MTALTLKEPVQVFVVRSIESNRYLVGFSKKTWSQKLTEARKFNRQSDAQNCANKLNKNVEVVPIVFTHGYQAV